MTTVRTVTYEVEAWNNTYGWMHFNPGPFRTQREAKLRLATLATKWDDPQNFRVVKVERTERRTPL